MKYYINYQHLPKGSSQPLDEGQTVRIDIQKDGQAILPSVGDYVMLNNSTNKMQSFQGRLKTRVFSYTGTTEDIELEGDCDINIVLEHTTDDWGDLIKKRSKTK